MDSIYLVGSDDVQRAGQSIRGAADDMLRAANTISESVGALRQLQSESSPNDRWEYCCLAGPPYELKKKANDVGIEGWEMVSVAPDNLAKLPGDLVAFMKRKL